MESTMDSESNYPPGDKRGAGMTNEEAFKRGLKWCSKCEQWLPATTEYFHRNRTKPDGFASYCKEDMKKFVADSRNRYPFGK